MYFCVWTGCNECPWEIMLYTKGMMAKQHIPVYPGTQLQLNDPGVFAQVAP